MSITVFLQMSSSFLVMSCAAFAAVNYSEQEIVFHMCHMSTSWSGDFVSCQSYSDYHTSNILYANQKVKQ